MLGDYNGIASAAEIQKGEKVCVLLPFSDGVDIKKERRLNGAP
nr:hypothetical protein [Providencia rettgeri]